MTDRAPLITLDADACRHCWRCAYRCPARAIRVSATGPIEIIEEKCVRCGLCVTECPQSAWVVRDDGAAVDALLVGSRPVVALLATEFVAALYPKTPADIEAALEEAGFYSVESTLLGEEAIAASYEIRHASGTGLPIIRSTCSVANDWISRYHPALAGALAPLVPPYIAQARLIRSMYDRDVAIVYVSPCFARKDEALSPEFGGAIDVAIDFLELEQAVSRLDAARAASLRPRERSGRGRPEPLKEISLTDGYPRSTLESRDMIDGDVRVVRGLAELEEVLRAVEAGESAPQILDVLNCEGCLDGPAANPGMSLFTKRHLASTVREERVGIAVSSREIIRHLPPLELRRSFVASPVRLPVPDDEMLAEIMREGRVDTDPLDCGMCGFSTCREYALSVFRGETTWDACMPLRGRRLADRIDGMEDCITLDRLTGASNEKAFLERLDVEFARHARYGGPLAVLHVCIDGMTRINDVYGLPAGDAVIAAVSEIIGSTLRATDLLARTGSERFGVVLPATSKTEAFAVAEKLRLLVADADFTFACPEAAVHRIDIRVSAGVSAASEETMSPVDIIRAADDALMRSKSGGGNQVRLAAG
ncbi:MAG TPA: diguanylate cyclase [Coriobacteriia bacterium]